MSASPVHANILATGGVDGRFFIWNLARHRRASSQLHHSSLHKPRQQSGIPIADELETVAALADRLADDSDDQEVGCDSWMWDHHLGRSRPDHLLCRYRYPPGQIEPGLGLIWAPPFDLSPPEAPSYAVTHISNASGNFSGMQGSILSNAQFHRGSLVSRASSASHILPSLNGRVSSARHLR
ncbi:unnamed protein product, partial [Protopolystoma xenopodis]